MMELTWKTHRYTWVAEPLPKQKSMWDDSFIPVHVVDEAIGDRYSAGRAYLAEELAGSTGYSLRAVLARLEELVLEGKVRVEEADYPSEATGPQILREHFTEA